MEILNGQNLGLIATIGIIATFWRQIIGFIKSSFNYIFGKHSLDRRSAISLIRYCEENFKEMPFRSRSLYQINAILNNDHIGPSIIDFKLCGTSVYFDGWKPLIIVGNMWASDHKVYLLRGIWNINNLFEKIAKNEYEFKNHSCIDGNRYFVKRLTGKSAKPSFNISSNDNNNDKKKTVNDLSENDLAHLAINEKLCTGISHNRKSIFSIDTNSKNPLDIYPFDDNTLDLLNKVKNWNTRKGWYQDRGLNYTIGIGLFGSVGTGKSTIAKTIAYNTNRPIYVLDLASMDNSELVEHWQRYCSDEVVFLIEDIDAVFDGRINISNDSENKVSFDCLINLINGVGNNHGLITIITSNHEEKLDPALLREGRIDHHLHLGKMSEKCRRQHAENLLQDASADIDTIVANGEGMVACQFHEFCLRHLKI